MPFGGGLFFNGGLAAMGDDVPISSLRARSSAGLPWSAGDWCRRFSLRWSATTFAMRDPAAPLPSGELKLRRAIVEPPGGGAGSPRRGRFGLFEGAVVVGCGGFLKFGGEGAAGLA